MVLKTEIADRHLRHLFRHGICQHLLCREKMIHDLHAGRGAMPASIGLQHRVDLMVADLLASERHCCIEIEEFASAPLSIFPALASWPTRSVVTIQICASCLALTRRPIVIPIFLVTGIGG